MLNTTQTQIFCISEEDEIEHHTKDIISDNILNTNKGQGLI